MADKVELTVKDGHVILDGTEPEYVKEEKALRELEQLQLIGLELGIKLTTLFDAFRNGIWAYYGDEDEIVHYEPKQLTFHFTSKCFYLKHYDKYGIDRKKQRYQFVFYLRNCGLNWAVNKEDLEKKLYEKETKND